jgi:hypothetical protein
VYSSASTVSNDGADDAPDSLSSQAVRTVRAASEAVAKAVVVRLMESDMEILPGVYHMTGWPAAEANLS